MVPPVSISKITPPRLPNILYRPRLLESIEKNKDKRLILILGQAAQGKSTLAASHVKESEVPSAWINLNRDDSEPVNLFYSTVHALQHVFPDIDLHSLLSYPSISMGPRLEIPLYREWTNAIFEKISFPVQIVLDGLDRLATDAPSFQLLKVLINDAPQHIHLIMLSREEPPFEIQGLKVKQKVYVLANEDLAFTPDEIQSFFQELPGISFGSDQLKKVHQFTEGWVGGLILLSETLDRFPEDKREKYLLESAPDRFKGAVFQYFGEEILSFLPEATQDFLIRSAIFEIIEPGIVRDLLGMEDTEEILNEHAKKNFFVQSNYDDKKGWVFRYHQLFRDFLQSKFRSEIGEEEKRAFFQNAGSIYEQRGRLEESVSFYFEAKAYDRAASVIEQIGMDLWRKGRTGDLAQWIKALPDDLVEGSPWLILCLFMTRRFTGSRENIISLQKALSLFEKEEDLSGRILSLASLIEATIMKGRDITPLAYLLNEGEKLLKTSDPDIYAYERAILSFQVGYGFILRGGNLIKGLWACENAYLISKDLGIFPIQVNALIHMIMAYTFLGEFALGDDACKKLDKTISKWSTPEFRSMQLLNYCHLNLWKGAFDKAEEAVREAKKQIETSGLTYLYSVTLLYDLALKFYAEDHIAGINIGNRLLELALSMDNLFLQGITRLFLALSFYRKEAFEKAGALVEDAIKILSSHEAWSHEHLNEGKVLMSLIAYHLQTAESHEKQLAKALNYFDEEKNLVFLINAHFAMALLKWNQADINKTVRHLNTGFQIAREKEFEFFPALSKKDLTKICVLALELGAKSAVDYAAHLLTTRVASEAGPELERLCKHSNRKIRGKAREIRIAIYRANVPTLRIQGLGRFEVFRADIPMKEGEWQRNQAKNLLKALVSHGPQGIPKEILMEDLWPESEQKAAQQNFKVTLHRLRKSLEPGMETDFGSSYLHLKNSILSLDIDRVELDTERFLSLLEQGELKERDKDLQGAIDLYIQAQELYKGDFLPGDLYAPWAEPIREGLKQKYLHLMLKLARLHENCSDFKKAVLFYEKAIHTDPILEEAYQGLMILYGKKGQKNNARKVFEACRTAVTRGLGCEPDSSTIEIYDKIEKNDSP